MWPKLLKSTAVEALRLREHKKIASVDAARVETFFRAANEGKETTIYVDRRTRLLKREGERHWLVESQDGPNWVHRSVLMK